MSEGHWLLKCGNYDIKNLTMKTTSKRKKINFPAFIRLTGEMGFHRLA